MSEKTCIVCGEPLSGKQTKYCSQKCSKRFYYKNNRKKILEYQKNYNLEHKEEYREYYRVYYQEHKDKYREYDRKHPQKKKEKNRKYRQKNKEKIRAYNRAYKRGKIHEYKWQNEYEKLYFDDPLKSATECKFCLYFDTCHGERETCEYK